MVRDFWSAAHPVLTRAEEGLQYRYARTGRAGSAVRNSGTLTVISILIAIAICLWRSGSRTSSSVVLAIALFLAMVIGCGSLPALLLQDLQTDYSADVGVQQGHATAIILLGNDTEHVDSAHARVIEVGPLGYARIVKALELYRACKRLNQTCFVLIAGGDPRHLGISEAAVYGAQLRQLGVDGADLLLEERSRNTFQNARYAAALLSTRPFDQVLLVSSGIHLRRSLLYFAHFGVQARPVRADFVRAMPSLRPLCYNFLATDLALHEYVGVLRYFVYQRMGWNVQATQPPAP